MLEALTGTGLAASAGLNAYIPLLTVGLLDRYTDWVKVPDGWQWLTKPWVLAILGVLLLVEFVADKVPVVDHVNDAIQTVIRPTAGGLSFGAVADAQTLRVDDPSSFFSDHGWLAVTSGVVIGLVVHLAKAALRSVVNLTTLGVGAPFVSTAEDGASVSMSLLAIAMPVLVALLLVGLVGAFWWAFRRRAQRRAEEGSASPAPPPY